MHAFERGYRGVNKIVLSAGKELYHHIGRSETTASKSGKGTRGRGRTLKARP